MSQFSGSWIDGSVLRLNDVKINVGLFLSTFIIIPLLSFVNYRRALNNFDTAVYCNENRDFFTLRKDICVNLYFLDYTE